MIKKIFTIFVLFFAYSFLVFAQKTKLPAHIETPIGIFKCEDEEISWYRCILENNSNEIFLQVTFKSGTALQEIDAMINELQNLYLHLPELEKKVCTYAAENAADGVYKEIISKTGRIGAIFFNQTELNKNSEVLEFWIVTETHIYGCDFICVYSDLNGSLDGAYLVGWQD